MTLLWLLSSLFGSAGRASGRRRPLKHPGRPGPDQPHLAVDDAGARAQATTRPRRPRLKVVPRGARRLALDTNDVCVVSEAQAIFFRRRHQPRRPPPTRIRPGSPAPTRGPGTGTFTNVRKSSAAPLGVKLFIGGTFAGLVKKSPHRYRCQESGPARVWSAR